MSQTINVNPQNVSVNVVEQVPVLDVTDNPISIDVLNGGGLIPITNDLTFIAGTNLSALRAVTSDSLGQVVYADNATFADAQVIGVTYTSANAGSQVIVITSGLFTDAGWSWTKGPVFLGSNGQLTQTPPTGGAILVHVGRALTATQVLIDIDVSITTV